MRSLVFPNPWGDRSEGGIQLSLRPHLQTWGVRGNAKACLLWPTYSLTSCQCREIQREILLEVVSWELLLSSPYSGDKARVLCPVLRTLF